MKDSLMTVRAVETFFRIWFDGGCEPNPGASYGSYEIIGGANGSVNLKALREKYGYGTSNTAEFNALIHSLQALLAHCKESHTDPGALRLSIWTDSRLVWLAIGNRKPSKMIHLQKLRRQAEGMLNLFGDWNLTWCERQNNVNRFGH